MLTTTNTELLQGLRDPANEPVWREFDSRYRPLLLAFARRLGLGDADAADAAQETLAQFVEDYRAGRYDPARGRLRSWIFGIAQRRVADMKRLKARRREQRGDSAFQGVPAEDELQGVWDDEWRKALLRQGLTELRAGTKMDPKTIRAFELVAFGQRRPAEAAAELGMTVNDVYVARSRVLDRLQRILVELEEIW